MRLFVGLFLLVSFVFSFNFDQYPSQNFEGKYTIPPTYQLQSNGWEYRDENNLSIGEIKANFAGKFCIILHPCGSGCRFYSLLDLESGREDYEILSDFNTTPDEREKPSIDVLISRKESNLLIVRSFFEAILANKAFICLKTKMAKLPQTHRTRGRLHQRAKMKATQTINNQYKRSVL